MPLTEAQELFSLFFAIYFALIIDRAHETYKPWDTYNAWRGKTNNIKRLLSGWIILFAIPLVHFALLFALLGTINIRLDLTISGISNLVLVGLSSFFDFGYFRIYEAFLHSDPGSFFSEEDYAQMGLKGKIRPDFWAHFIPGALYVAGSTLMLIIAIYY